MAIVENNKKINSPKLSQAFFYCLLLALYMVAFTQPFVGNRDIPSVIIKDVIITIPEVFAVLEPAHLFVAIFRFALAAFSVSIIIIVLITSILAFILDYFNRHYASFYLALTAILISLIYFAASVIYPHVIFLYFNEFFIGYFALIAANIGLLIKAFLTKKLQISQKAVGIFVLTFISIFVAFIHFSASQIELEQEQVRQNAEVEKNRIRLEEQNKRTQQIVQQNEQRLAQIQLEMAQQKQQEKARQIQAELDDPELMTVSHFVDDFLYASIYQNTESHSYAYLNNKQRQTAANSLKVAYKNWLLELYTPQRKLLTSAMINQSTSAFLYALQQTKFKVLHSERIDEKTFKVTLKVQGFSYAPITEAVKNAVQTATARGKINQRNSAPYILAIEAQELRKVSMNNLLPEKEISILVKKTKKGYSMQLNDVINLGLITM